MPKGLERSKLAGLILEHAREYAVLTFEADGRVTSWSPGAERVFGRREEEMIGAPIDITFTATDQAAGAPQRERETARREGRAENSRWHCRKTGERFWGNGVTLHIEEPEAGEFLKILRDETRIKLADEQRILLLNELNHRVKNTLATVQSIAEQTLRAGKVDIAVRENLTERLQALSHAHDLLVTESWAGADLEAVVEKALAPHRHDQLKVFSIDGPPVRLSPPQAVAISLVLHELATNALKHGALSAPGGEVSITWNLAVDGDGRRHMSLLWAESGGPPVVTPASRGFGTRMIARTFSAQSGGRAQLDYAPGGLRCSLDLLLSQPGEIPMLDVSKG
ncbi:sensor histidine kinase [Phenylobacterium sp.]|jgi:PAS domain S-box-containing protein|uniref:sensor histidine kinase n=1 Tax=Phenylobacterium sp. TaxID=1871053 RepID=UPI002F935529